MVHGYDKAIIVSRYKCMWVESVNMWFQEYVLACSETSWTCSIGNLKSKKIDENSIIVRTWLQAYYMYEVVHGYDKAIIVFHS